MLTRLMQAFGRRAQGPAGDAHALYGMVVARARQPRLYTVCGLPDTLDGRFEALVWHLAPVVLRLQEGGPSQFDAAQELFDAFLADMDAAMREEGVGDQAVPKRLQKMTRAFQGHAKALDAWRDGPATVGGLDEILRRNIEGLPAHDTLARTLAAYTEQVLTTEPQALAAGALPDGVTP